MTYLPIAFLILPWFPAPGLTSPPPTAFFQPAAVLLNLSERDLNRIVVDSFHANLGPQVVGGRARVSASVADLRYRASLSDPVLRLGEDGTALLSLDILDASLRIGLLQRKIAGLGARCEEAGLDVDPMRPLRIDLALDLAIEGGAFRILPRSVEIPDLGDRLQLVRPTRCSHSVFPDWFLWWAGRPFLRRSVDNLDRVLLERARKGAVRLENKEGLKKGWSQIHLFPEALETSGGSLLLELTASSADPVADAAPPHGLDGRGSLPSGSFLGLAESFVNALARHTVFGRPGSPMRSRIDAQRLLASDAVYALIPGLRAIDAREQLDLEVVLHEAPRFAFRTLDGDQAVIDVLVSGMDIDIRRSEAGEREWLGAVHVESGHVAAVPVTNLLGGISFRMVENRWRVSSTGLEFDDELVAATLQEIAFGKIFETSYEPLLTRTLHIGDTEFQPRSFAVIDGYLVIGLGERPPTEVELRSSGAAMRTGTLLESR